jgi:hypothetical protein
MLQPYFFDFKRGYKWYRKLFEKLLNVAIHNFMIIYRYTPNNKGADSLKFRLLLIQCLVQIRGPATPHSVHSHPSTEPPSKRLVISCTKFLPQERRLSHKGDVLWAKRHGK